MFTLGRGAGMGLRETARTVEQSLPPIAGILLIVAAGGGFKQTLIDTGIGEMVGHLGREQRPVRAAAGLAGRGAHPAGDRLGHRRDRHRGRHPGPAGHRTSAPARPRCWSSPSAAGSLFFSHVNDAGFWLVKEYFGLSVGQTIKTWSLMETAISVSGLVFVLVLNLAI